MSLIKALTGKGKSRATMGGFDRKQAYTLLRCVDKDGHRRVTPRDLVAFVFATWTEELNRLGGGRGVPEDEAVRRKRRQLQKVT